MVPPVPSANRSQRIFVSYSHTDRALVVPIVQVLRAANDWVFFDVDSIRGGDRWREAIRESLRDADLVVVFWCHHSRASSEVADEYRHALTLRKRLMPVRLDQTPLAPEL